MPAPKLLLVEDDPALAELLEFRFEGEGYVVRSTPNGDEALLLSAEEAPDLVVLDRAEQDADSLRINNRAVMPDPRRYEGATKQRSRVRRRA